MAVGDVNLASVGRMAASPTSSPVLPDVPIHVSVQLPVGGRRGGPASAASLEWAAGVLKRMSEDDWTALSALLKANYSDGDVNLLGRVCRDGERVAGSGGQTVFRMLV